MRCRKLLRLYLGKEKTMAYVIVKFYINYVSFSPLYRGQTGIKLGTTHVIY